MGFSRGLLKFHLRYEPETGFWYSRATGVRIDSKSSKGYRCVRWAGKKYPAHRLALYYMTGKWGSPFVDHRDGVRSKNSAGNIRPATRAQNCWNRRTPKNNTSGHKGVHWHGDAGKWLAAITYNGKRLHLGLYECKETAAKVRNVVAQSLHGDFFRAG